MIISGNGILHNINTSQTIVSYNAFDRSILNSLIYRIRRGNYKMGNTDKFGNTLTIGDTIIVCFSKHGRLSKATIIGEREKVWKIKVEYSYGTDERTMDKNLERIIKYD